MKHIIYLSIVLMLIVSACSLGSDTGNADEIDETEETIEVNNPVATEELTQPTNTPQPTVTPIINNTNTPTNNTNTTCVPQTNWVRYTVVSGDTLSSIASRVNSNINELATANCLTNVNNLVVGQQLYVPRLPIIVVPTNTPSGASNPVIIEQGGVGITQQLAGDAGNISVLTGATATLTWQDAPSMPTATIVQFRLMPNRNTFTGGILIGTDTNLANGISAQWVIPPNVQGVLMAFAYANEVTLVAQTAFTNNVFSGGGTGQRCVITLNSDMNYFDEPFDETAVGSYSAGTSFEVLGRHLAGWYAVHPNNTGAGGVLSLFWLPVDADVTESGTNC